MTLLLLLFSGAALLLALEGKLALGQLAPGRLTRAEAWLLGFPLGAFLNALLFFLCTLLHVPLFFWIIFPLHLLVVAALMFSGRRGRIVRAHTDPGSKRCGVILSGDEGCTASCHGSSPLTMTRCITLIRNWYQDDTSGVFMGAAWKKFLLIFLLLSLSIKVLYAVSHAVLLPSFFYDTLSQWNMRARISFEEQAIAFDATEARGISKPQYPILLHALQIVFMLPQGAWYDRLANSATLLLSASSFVALFLLSRRFGGVAVGVAVCSLLFLVPLFSFHLSQGYGDVHVVAYLLLSAIFLVLFLKQSDGRLLLLSALFSAAAAWVKQEGLFFGVLPWVLIVLSLLRFHLPFAQLRQAAFQGILPALLLGGMWTLFLLLRGLNVGAHSNDFVFRWHGEAVIPIMQHLFAYGSFGIFWYVLPLVLAAALFRVGRRWREFLPALAILSWGLITFLEALVVYAFTRNVEFLLNGQTFSRTMLIPLSLLILATVLLVWQVLSEDEAPLYS